MIDERLQKVRKRVAEAALRSGRSPEEITILAVSKIKPAADILEAYRAGQRHFGENYVQEFQAKKVQLGELPGAVFHLIGKLQSNKTKPASSLFDVIQTVDSVKVARRLNEQTERRLDVFLELKVSDEPTKGGLTEEELPALKEFVESCENMHLRGLMGMPPWSEDPEKTRPYFRRLRETAERLGLQGLSMGMSHDLEIAIEEGATLVRVGTAIFGKRVYSK